MTEAKQPKRTCPECGHVIYWAIYCSNVCSDKAYQRWREENPEMVDNDKEKR